MEYVREDEKTSLQLALILGSVMAMDFMIVYLSIFEYWTEDLGGSMHAFGLVFACYDLTQLVFLPIFGVIVKRVGFRSIYIASLVFNIIGNILYSTALNGDPDTATTRFVMGRLIAGIGSACYVLILGQLVMVVPTAHRGEGFVTFRMYTFFGRFSGPLIGYLLLYIPESSLGQLKFDGKTLPGWVVVILDIVLLAGFCSKYFKDPSNGNTPLLEDEEEEEEEEENQQQQQQKNNMTDLAFSTKRDLATIVCANFLLLFGFWSIFGQMMPITMIRFNEGVKSASTVYGVCGLGFYLSSVAYKRIAREKLFSEGSLACIGTCIAAAACCLLFQYSSDYDTDKSHMWMWYLGCGLTVFGFSMASSTTAALYSIVVDETSMLMPLLALLAVSSALGRFAGPSFSSLLLHFDAVNGTLPCDREHLGNCSLQPSSVNTLVGMVTGFMVVVCVVAGLVYRRISSDRDAKLGVSELN
eukprot:TRINITY_DN4528_c2_g2_i3.p1 TRINITY_DN4528_c2_g2~~TRINITY_DN4528_c2_g2_i3.p1  ORF type:complete len:470 (+),score=68.10 TRINITY_DN4528_c2_g2_i3:56-1465(+)